jgi:hypothetical protein
MPVQDASQKLHKYNCTADIAHSIYKEDCEYKYVQQAIDMYALASTIGSCKHQLCIHQHAGDVSLLLPTCADVVPNAVLQNSESTNMIQER